MVPRHRLVLVVGGIRPLLRWSRDVQHRRRPERRPGRHPVWGGPLVRGRSHGEEGDRCGDRMAGRFVPRGGPHLSGPPVTAARPTGSLVLPDLRPPHRHGLRPHIPRTLGLGGRHPLEPRYGYPLHERARHVSVLRDALRRAPWPGVVGRARPRRGPRRGRGLRRRPRRSKLVPVPGLPPARP